MRRRSMHVREVNGMEKRGRLWTLSVAASVHGISDAHAT
jgi:hypothetical protein